MRYLIPGWMVGLPSPGSSLRSLGADAESSTLLDWFAQRFGTPLFLSGYIDYERSSAYCSETIVQCTPVFGAVQFPIFQFRE